MIYYKFHEKNLEILARWLDGELGIMCRREERTVIVPTLVLRTGMLIF